VEAVAEDELEVGWGGRCVEVVVEDELEEVQENDGLEAACCEG
jgi:hypothetical protein